MRTEQIVSKVDYIATQLAKDAQPMSHKEMTAHIRRRIKAAGIKVRVQMGDANGARLIQVFGVTYEAEFSDEQQRTIRQIAIVNGLTWVRGLPIDVEQMTNSKQFTFQH